MACVGQDVWPESSTDRHWCRPGSAVRLYAQRASARTLVGMIRENLNTDHQIQTAIIKRFDWSPDVSAEHIGVAVTEGAVTLSGEVESLAERNAAIREATRIKGVAAVVDDIVVGRTGHPAHDADVARSVQSMLTHLPDLYNQSVSATVLEPVRQARHGTTHPGCGLRRRGRQRLIARHARA
jgi:BON domain